MLPGHSTVKMTIRHWAGKMTVAPMPTPAHHGGRESSDEKLEIDRSVIDGSDAPARATFTFIN